MSLLSLYAGLLLPWIAGTAWLIFFDNLFHGRQAPNRYRQAGYGFFVGYAILFCAVIACNTLIGAVHWPVVMVLLLIFTLAGIAAVRLHQCAGISLVIELDVDV